VDPTVEGLFQVQNKGTGVEQYRHNTVEIAVFNIMSWLWEIETGEPYSMTKEHNIFSGLGSELNEHHGPSAPGPVGADASQNTAEALRRARSIVRSLTGFRLRLVCDSVENLCSKGGATHGLFDTAFLSTVAAQAFSNANLLPILSPDAAVVTESAAHLVPLSKEQEKEYDHRLTDLVARIGFSNVPSPFKMCTGPAGDGEGTYEPLKAFRRDHVGATSI